MSTTIEGCEFDSCMTSWLFLWLDLSGCSLATYTDKYDWKFSARSCTLRSPHTHKELSLSGICGWAREGYDMDAHTADYWSLSWISIPQQTPSLSLVLFPAPYALICLHYPPADVWCHWTQGGTRWWWAYCWRRSVLMWGQYCGISSQYDRLKCHSSHTRSSRKLGTQAYAEQMSRHQGGKSLGWFVTHSVRRWVSDKKTGSSHKLAKGGRGGVKMGRPSASTVLHLWGYICRYWTWIPSQSFTHLSMLNIYSLSYPPPLPTPPRLSHDPAAIFLWLYSRCLRSRHTQQISNHVGRLAHGG